MVLEFIAGLCVGFIICPLAIAFVALVLAARAVKGIIGKFTKKK